MSSEPGEVRRPRPFSDYDFALIRGALKRTALTIEPVVKWGKDADAYMDYLDARHAADQKEIARLRRALGSVVDHCFASQTGTAAQRAYRVARAALGVQEERDESESDSVE